MKKSRSFNVLRNISFGYMQQIFSLILAFVTRTIFIKTLGAEYVGINGLFSNILTLLSLAELGIGNILTYNLYSALKNNNIEEIKQYINYYKKLYYLIAITIAILGSLIIPFLNIIVNSELSMAEIIKYYILYLTNTVVSYFVVYKTTLLQADQKIYIKNIISMITMIVQYLLQIWYLIKYKDFFGFLLIQVLCSIVHNLICNYICNKNYPYLKEKTKKSNYINKKEILSNTKSMFIYKVSNVIVTSTDNILISILLGTIYVGMYSNYYTLINYVSTFINLTITGIIGSLGNLNAENDLEYSHTMFLRLSFLFNVITIGCVACFASIVQDFIPIWIGEEYLLGIDVVWTILLTFFVTHAFDPSWMFCETMGLFKERKYSMVFNAILNIILSVILSRIMGLSGIILATGISRIFTNVWWEPYILYSKKFKKNILEYVRFQIKLLFMDFIFLGIYLFIISFFETSILVILIKLIICLVIFCIVIFAFMHNSDEFNWVKDKIVNIIKK